MRRITSLITLGLILNTIVVLAQGPKSATMQTKWGKKVTAENVWQEYPRPQLEREDWMNLNGHWDYAIVDKNAAAPQSYQGKILVPFAVESSLSGVAKAVTPDDKVWYSKTFTLPKNWGGREILLHFDAVDWETKVWLNGKEVGSHKGGSDPFTFNITPYLKSGEQELKVSVWDPSDTGMQPRGKQVLNPRSIWYTSVTGIWQTVWLEPVQKTFIKSIEPVADIDNCTITIKNAVEGATANTQFAVEVLEDGKVIATGAAKANQDLKIAIKNAKLWWPENPFLYELKVTVKNGNKTVDEADSYFAMRKISKAKGELGYERMLLNNEPRFQYGTLDQGWWPDGLLTPPSEEAMQYDMDVLKEMGFNMLRKHIKVEPSRYYYYADKIGLLIWQDMVSGYQSAEDKTQHLRPNYPEDWDRPAASVKQWETEWKAIMDHLRFFPSIVTWVPFNEGWGQFETDRIVKWTQDYDTTRLVDGVSGWTDRGVGDMNDAHHYPGPGAEPAEQNPGRIIVLGEFGGLGLPVDGHLWNPDMRNWGYRTYHTVDELKKQYATLIHNMVPMVNKGLSAAVYTQTTDVEGEVNGLLTYDREVIKMDTEYLKSLNTLLYAKPTKVTPILPDSELSDQKVWVSTQAPSNGKAQGAKEQNGLVNLTKEDHVWLTKKFNLNKTSENLQLRLYGAGDIKVFINGEKVADKFIGSRRGHYDELNINEFASSLKKGENIITMEVNNVRNEAEFDFGLYTY